MGSKIEGGGMGEACEFGDLVEKEGRDGDGGERGCELDSRAELSPSFRFDPAQVVESLPFSMLCES